MESILFSNFFKIHKISRNHWKWSQKCVGALIKPKQRICTTLYALRAADSPETASPVYGEVMLYIYIYMATLFIRWSVCVNLWNSMEFHIIQKALEVSPNSQFGKTNEKPLEVSPLLGRLDFGDPSTVFSLF